MATLVEHNAVQVQVSSLTDHSVGLPVRLWHARKATVAFLVSSTVGGLSDVIQDVRWLLAATDR